MRSDSKKRVSLFLVFLCMVIGYACALSTPRTSLGGVYFTDEGGYEIQVVNDYIFTEFSGGFEMVMPDTSLLFGPGFLVYGGLIDEERTNEELWESITQAELKNFQLEQPRSRNVDGISGLLGEFHGLQNKTKVFGKLFLTMVDKKQQFILIGFAPENEWKKFEPIYDMVLKTVKFYIPNRSLKLENKFKREINESEFLQSPGPGTATEGVP